MTVNGVIVLILRFLLNSIALQADNVEDRPTMSVKYYLPVPVFHFWPKLITHLQRGLSAIAELLVTLIPRDVISHYHKM